MPDTSGASGFTDDTDYIIWGGFAPLGGIAGSVERGIGQSGCSGSNCSDMWSLLKGTGTGLIGTLMSNDSSQVGLPPARVFAPIANENCVNGLRGTSAVACGSAITTVCTDGTASQANWACVREGFQAGDLRPNDGTNMYYWGTYCAAGDTDTAGSISGPTGTQSLARSCISNGGTWRTQKNYQGSDCRLDPSTDAAIQPADMN